MKDAAAAKTEATRKVNLADMENVGVRIVKTAEADKFISTPA